MFFLVYTGYRIERLASKPREKNSCRPALLALALLAAGEREDLWHPGYSGTSITIKYARAETTAQKHKKNEHTCLTRAVIRSNALGTRISILKHKKNEQFCFSCAVQDKSQISGLVLMFICRGSFLMLMLIVLGYLILK